MRWSVTCPLPIGRKRRRDNNGLKFATLRKNARLFQDGYLEYSACVPRNLHNWSYQRVTDFLKEHGFVFLEELEGRRVWTKLKNGEPVRFVELSIKSEKYSTRTVKNIIRQSGIA